MYHLLLLCAYTYIPSALIVFFYSFSEHLDLMEIDTEGLHTQPLYVPYITWREHAQFLANILVPGWNLFCAALIVFIEMSDRFADWILNTCLQAEQRKARREENKLLT